MSLSSDILVFNSKNKSSGTNQNANYNLINMGGIGASFTPNYELLSYHSNNEMYNVEVGVNDKVYFAEGAGLLTGTLVAGNYNTTTFLVAIKAAMNAVSGSNYNISTYDADTGKYTFDITAGTFQFLFSANTTATSRRLLGMDAFDDALAASHVADNVACLRLHSNIFIRIPQEANKHVTLLDGTEYSLMIPLNTSFGEEIHHRKQEHYAQFLLFSTNISSIDIVLFTQDGVALVNAPDYELVLRKIT